jgi:hypothetical protein
MKWEDDILNKTKQFGVLGYPLSKCVNILDMGADMELEYETAWNTEGSAIRKAYQKGSDYRDFAFDSKLFDMAKGGDVRAMKMFEERNKQQRLKKIKGI